MSDDNEGQDYKGEFVATGGRSVIRSPSELVPSKPLALQQTALLTKASAIREQKKAFGFFGPKA